LIELPFGARPSHYGKKDVTRLIDALSPALQDDAAGYYGGRVVIPETTTLMFYGADAEAMFRIAESILRAEKMCAGAKITIRQASEHREVLVPGVVM
jgi:hypothetical protein